MGAWSKMLGWRRVGSRCVCELMGPLVAEAIPYRTPCRGMMQRIPQNPHIERQELMWLAIDWDSFTLESRVRVDANSSDLLQKVLYMGWRGPIF